MERYLMDHFIHCVRRYGYPEGKHWNDDAVIGCEAFIG